jgi:hypothetical protein
MQKCGQPSEAAGDHVAAKQWVLAEKERQVADFNFFQPQGKGLLEDSFDYEPEGNKVEVGVVAGNQDLGQAPKDKSEDESACHPKSSVLLRQCKLRMRHD